MELNLLYCNRNRTLYSTLSPAPPPRLPQPGNAITIKPFDNPRGIVKKQAKAKAKAKGEGDADDDDDDDDGPVFKRDTTLEDLLPFLEGTGGY